MRGVECVCVRVFVSVYICVCVCVFVSVYMCVLVVLDRIQGEREKHRDDLLLEFFLVQV